MEDEAPDGSTLPQFSLNERGPNGRSGKKGRRKEAGTGRMEKVRIGKMENPPAATFARSAPGGWGMENHRTYHSSIQPSRRHARFVLKSFDNSADEPATCCTPISLVPRT